MRQEPFPAVLHFYLHVRLSLHKKSLFIAPHLKAVSVLQAPVVLAVSKAAASSAVAAAASPPVAAAAAVATAPEREQLVTQQGADTADFAPSCTADDWDWQQSQSQANLGFQDAFEATQGFGVTPDLTPAATWAAPKPAAQPAGLPIKPAGQAKAQHVPFSTRRIALPSAKPEMKQCAAVAVPQPNCEFLNVRRPLPKQQGPQSPQHTAVANTSAQSQGAGIGARRQSSWAPPAASVPRSQMVTLPAGHAQALAVCDSHPRHDAAAANATAAATHHAAQGTGTTAAHPSADPHTLGVARPQAQTARTQATKLNSGHKCATATASGKATMSNKSTAAAARGRSPSPAAAAASPAAAIFGPHIAEPVCSQSHAKKKLCLRLAPRQAEPTADVSSTTPAAAGLHHAGSSSPAHQQPQAQHGPVAAAAVATAEECLAQSSSPHQQNRDSKGQCDRKVEGECHWQVKGPGNDEAVSREVQEAVMSPTGNSLAVASPEAATPSGQLD